MTTQFTHKFKKGFLLGEEQLRKLVDIITERTTKARRSLPLAFTIDREDLSRRTTNDLMEVLAETNTKANRIKELLIAGDDRPRRLKLSIRFKRTEKTELQIESDNTDLLYLLSSEVKLYVQDEISTYRSKLPLFVTLFALLVFGVASFYFRNTMSVLDTGSSAALESEIRHAIESPSIEEKLNALLKKDLPARRQTQLLDLAVGFLIVGGSSFFFSSILTPTLNNRFLLGQEIERFKRYRSIESKLIWGVVIGFLVNLIAGLVLQW